jgi:hypothetical protein
MDSFLLIPYSSLFTFFVNQSWIWKHTKEANDAFQGGALETIFLQQAHPSSIVSLPFYWVNE